MKISIRVKLMIAITVLIAVLFGIVAALFIGEKRTELAEDIYVNSLAFARLTAPEVVEDYELFLAEGSFVYFNREMQGIFAQNADVDRVQVVTYSGDVVYDSLEDTERRFEGPRRVDDSQFLEVVKSENVGVRTLEGASVFLKDGEFVDVNEGRVEALEAGTLVEYFAVPVDAEFSVVYFVDYSNLEARVGAMMQRIILMAIFGVMLGILMAFVMSSTVTRPVAKLVKGAEGIAGGDFKTRVSIKAHDEIGYLGDAFNKMAVDLEASMDARAYKMRVARELELASEIQKQILPDVAKMPQVQGLEIAAGLVPAAEIGGDMYDFVAMEDGRLLFYIGDVTGHGVPAGIVSSVASSVIYGYRGEKDLKNLLIALNDVLQAKTMSTMFLTLCLMQWDAASGLSYVNAGHEQLIHYKAAEGRAHLLPSGGIALGMVNAVADKLSLESVDLQPGDLLISYSDGIVEAWKNEKEKYGAERLLAAVEKLGTGSAAQVKDGILADVEAYVAGQPKKDDITLVVVKRV